MTLSPSVVQLFSMKPSIIPPCTPPRSQTSDSGIESVKSKKQGRGPNNFNNHNHSTLPSINNFRGRGNSDPAVKKHNANNIKHFNKSEKQRASSLSPTKNLHTSSTSPKTAKKANYQKPTGTSKNITNFQGGRTPPRFGNGFKKQHSAPIGTGSKSSSHPTAIHTTPSSPTFRKKQQSSTAMKPKNNNHTHHHHSKNQDSDSGSASSGSNKSASTRTTKSFVRTASLHGVHENNNNNKSSHHHHAQQRQRNDNSFSNTIYRDELWAGSAASPAATALPQPPIAWLKIKEEPSGEGKAVEEKKGSMIMENMLKTQEKSSEIRHSEISARNATTTKSPLATSVQQMFASFNSPLVSTTA